MIGQATSRGWANLTGAGSARGIRMAEAGNGSTINDGRVGTEDDAAKTADAERDVADGGEHSTAVVGETTVGSESATLAYEQEK